MARVSRSLLTAALASALAGCGAPLGNGPLTTYDSPPTTTSADLVLSIPAGTWAAEARGEPAYTLPAEIQLVAGQSVVVRNEDDAMHYFFYVPIAPGQSLRKTFSQPGRYGYSGPLSCSIISGSALTVTVELPRPVASRKEEAPDALAPAS